MTRLKLPVPDPSFVKLSESPGIESALQQIPLAMTGDPPSEVMIPPHFAVVSPMSAIADVVRTGTVGAGFSGVLPVSFLLQPFNKRDRVQAPRHRKKHAFLMGRLFNKIEPVPSGKINSEPGGL
jgi:hypothetical protein